jgi:hypothetical protein
MYGRSRFQFAGLFIFGLVVCLGLAGCGGNKVTKANYDKISNDMTEAQVKDVLGSPTETKSAGGAGSVMIWKGGDDTISVTFVNGKVAGKISSFDVKGMFGK